MDWWGWGILIFAVLAGFVVLVRRRPFPAGLLRPSYGWGYAPGTWQPCGERHGETGFPKQTRDNASVPLPGWKRLRQAPSDRSRLQAAGMPVLGTTDDLLRWLKLDLPALVALANPANRLRPGRTNYIEWSVPKKRHGVRIICSPKPRLKTVQHRIKREILDRAPPHEAAHGFVPGRNIVTNAKSHVGRPLIVNLDLVSFFDYVRYRRVIGVYRRLGYSLEVSRWLAQLCTHRPNLSAFVGWHGSPGYVRRAFRHAVQGAPTSPALANLSVTRLDRRLNGLAQRHSASYTRYADDLTFSGDEPFKRSMIRFLPFVREIIEEEGFKLNLRKMRFMRPGQRQEVTGVIVNQKTNARREDFDRLKAIVHNSEKAGSLESQNRANHPDFRAHLLARAAHVRLLNSARGQRLIDRIAAIS